MLGLGFLHVYVWYANYQLCVLFTEADLTVSLVILATSSDCHLLFATSFPPPPCMHTHTHTHMQIIPLYQLDAVTGNLLFNYRSLLHHCCKCCDSK